MAKCNIDREFYYKLSQENELFNASCLTGAQIARCSKVSTDLLSLIKCYSGLNGENVSFDSILNNSFNHFAIFNNDELFKELSLLSNVDCVYENGNNEFDGFSVRSRMVLLDTGAYTIPEQLMVPYDIKKASTYYLSHDICHMLKERNKDECELKNGFLEVVPMLVELIFSYTNDYDSFLVVLNNRIKRMKVNASDFISLYESYIDADSYEDKKLYLTALSEIGKYLHSFYYTLLLFKIYLGDKQYFVGSSNEEFILNGISEVLLCKMNTKEMIEGIINNIGDIDIIYDNAIDTVNEMVMKK